MLRKLVVAFASLKPQVTQISVDPSASTSATIGWVSGFDKASSLRIGSSTAWVTETAGATAGFLEFTGQGLVTFERAMDRDERLLAVLGSRLLEGQKKVGETAQTVASSL